MDEVTRTVVQRGGPSAPWIVDVTHRVATLGHAWIKFKPLGRSAFLPQSYGRSDIAPDLTRDRALIEDGYACIAVALERTEVSRRRHNWNLVGV